MPFATALTRAQTATATGGGVPDPVAGPCGITDTFERGVVSGLGTSDCGAVWADFVAAPGTIKVYAGEGRFHIPAVVDGGDQFNPHPYSELTGLPMSGTFSALIGMRWDSAHVTGVFDAQQTSVGFGAADGGTVYMEVWTGAPADDGGKLYLVASAGKSAYVPFIPTIGVDYTVRFEQTSGVTARVRIWPASEPEPIAWTITLDVSTAVPFSGPVTMWLEAVGPGNASEPCEALDVTWAYIDIDGVDSCTACITDSYTRLNAADLGTADFGTSYTYSGSHGNKWSVDGERARHDFPSILSAFLQWTGVATLALPSAGDKDVRFDFEFSTMPDTTHGYQFLRIGRYGVDGGADVTIVGQAPTPNQLSIFSGSGSTTTSVAISGRMHGRILFGSTVQVKIWPYGDAEPASWNVSRALDGAYPAEVDIQHWQIAQDGSTPTYASTLWFDNLDIDGVASC